MRGNVKKGIYGSGGGFFLLSFFTTTTTTTITTTITICRLTGAPTPIRYRKNTFTVRV